jgi:hypothetical protein
VLAKATDGTPAGKKLWEKKSNYFDLKSCYSGSSGSSSKKKKKCKESRVDFTLKCEKKGKIRVIAKVKTKGSANEVYLKVNGKSKQKFTVGSHKKSFKWSEKSKELSVKSGEQDFQVLGKEKGVKLMYLKIVDGEENCKFKLPVKK